MILFLWMRPRDSIFIFSGGYASFGREGASCRDNVLQDGDMVESRYAVTRRNRTIHSRMREYLMGTDPDPALETVVLPIGDGVTVSTKTRTDECGLP